MSKIGKKIISIPDTVDIKLQDGLVMVKGPKGQQEVSLHPQVILEIADKSVQVSVKNPEDRKQKALWGTFRALIQNAIHGVTVGFEKKLDIVGVGYKSAVSNGKIVLNVGYSHPVELLIPQGLEAKVEKNTITISGIDKQLVGEYSAKIREVRKPEPYKGKGIKYSDEIIRRKAGKVVKAVGG